MGIKNTRLHFKGAIKLVSSSTYLEENEVVSDNFSSPYNNSIELAQSLALLDAVIEATADAIVVYSLEHHILKMNHNYCAMMNIDKYDACLHDIHTHFNIFSQHCLNADAFLDRFKKYLHSPNSDTNFIIKLRNNRFYNFTNTPYTINGHLLGRVLAFHDITNQKRTELELIEREALYKDLSIKDNLTGIYNRRKILLELKNCFELSKPHKNPTSLIMFDLNDFKKINDTYGHGMGDFVLQRITESISACLRKKDIFGRWGGDEFVILMPDCDRTKAEKTTLKIQSRLTNLGLPVKTPISCSFGISTTEEEQCPESLIHRADMAMYFIKNKSKDKK